MSTKGSDVPDVLPAVTNIKVKTLNSWPWFVVHWGRHPGIGTRDQIKMIRVVGTGAAGILRRGS